MSDAGVPTRDVRFAPLNRGSVMVLAVGFGLSVMAHLGVGYGASAYFLRVWDADDSGEKAIEVEAEASEMSAIPDKVRLGMDEAKVASINWLGVVEDARVGDVPEAVVEQAEFTRQVGDAPMTTAPEPRVEPVIEQVAEVVEVETQADVETEVAEILTEQIELDLEGEIDDAVVIEVQAEPVEEPAEEPVEEALEEQVEQPDTPVVEPTPEAQEVSPATAGKVGIVSEKESAASKIKRAEVVDATDLHKPIVGEGFEIITVEPKFPASVRFTELPSNPVVMIQFDATGKVRKAYFLREGIKTYDTGVKGVDEPLLNAIYQWRAKGKEIEALDGDDPKSVVEIPMRITFRKERKEEP